MTYKVLKEGRGPLYSHLKPGVVATGLTWQEAHDKVFALKEQCSASWDFWFTND